MFVWVSSFCASFPDLPPGGKPERKQSSTSFFFFFSSQISQSCTLLVPMSRNCHCTYFFFFLVLQLFKAGGQVLSVPVTPLWPDTSFLFQELFLVTIDLRWIALEYELLFLQFPLRKNNILYLTTFNILVYSSLFLCAYLTSYTHNPGLGTCKHMILFVPPICNYFSFQKVKVRSAFRFLHF